MEEEARALGDAVRQWLKGYPIDAPVVVVPVFNAYADVIECIESLLAHTEDHIPLLIVDDGSSDRRIADLLGPLSVQRGFKYLRKPMNEGFVATMNLAFEWTASRDVVLINSDIIVPSDWLERLRDAAYAHTTTATATPLTNHGSILSIPYRNTPTSHLPRGLTVDELDRRIRADSLKVYPVIPTAIGHCTYFKRQALTSVGYFDPAFSPGYGEEVDFSQRAVMAGFRHVAADDLFVFHKGSRSFGGERDQIRELSLRRMRQTHERRIATRYPWYHPWVQIAERSTRTPLAQALDTARTASIGKHIAIDATSINGTVTGTQMVTLELVRALCLCKNADAHIHLIVQDGLDHHHLCGVDDLVDAVVPLSAVRSRNLVFDLIHRPFQVHTADELHFLKQVAHRCVVTHLDFISYSNPSYYPRTEDWVKFRTLTSTMFGSVDGVVFISRDARNDAKHLGFAIPDERSCVTYVGIDHHIEGEATDQRERYPKTCALPEGPFLLMLGTNFRHKNRIYAIRLFRALVDRYGWSGSMVFAGPTAYTGGSEAEEALERLKGPALGSRIHYLEHVDEEEKWWILRHAALVLYPSIYEGFGIVPFEAAAVGTPTISTRMTSLHEVLGSDVLSLDLHDLAADAEKVWTIMTDPEIASRQVKCVTARAAPFVWSRVAATTWDFYERILRQPRRSVLESTTDAEPTSHENAKQQKHYQVLLAEYRRLEKWAQELNGNLLARQDLEEWAQELNGNLLALQDAAASGARGSRVVSRLRHLRRGVIAAAQHGRGPKGRGAVHDDAR